MFPFFRLEDFENSCAAYEKAIELSDDYLTHLNYTITLFSNDEIERARTQYQKFETLYKKQSEENSEVDPDVKIQSDLMMKALFPNRAAGVR